MATSATDRRLITIVLVIIAALLLIPLVGSLFGMTRFGMGGGMWGGGMWGTPMQTPTWLFLVGAVMQFLFLAAIVVGGYLIYRAVVRSDGGTDRALEELRLAYARGDLSEEEYERRREALEAER